MARRIKTIQQMWNSITINESYYSNNNKLEIVYILFLLSTFVCDLGLSLLVIKTKKPTVKSTKQYYYSGRQSARFCLSNLGTIQTCQELLLQRSSELETVRSSNYRCNGTAAAVHSKNNGTPADQSTSSSRSLYSTRATIGVTVLRQLSTAKITVLRQTNPQAAVDPYTVHKFLDNIYLYRRLH